MYSKVIIVFRLRTDCVVSEDANMHKIKVTILDDDNMNIETGRWG